MLALILSLAVAAGAPETPPPVEQNVALGTDRTDRMTVPVSVAGSEEMPFVIDTGAERTVISRQLAARLNLPKGPVRNLMTVTGSGKVDTVIVPSLELSGSKVREIEAPALDEAHLGAGDGRLGGRLGFGGGQVAAGPQGGGQGFHPFTIARRWRLPSPAWLILPFDMSLVCGTLIGDTAVREIVTFARKNA